MRQYTSLALLLLAPLLMAAAPPRSSIALTHVTVIDGSGATPAKDQTVLVGSGRIVAVGAAAQIRLPGNAQVVNSAGKFLIPGLWDMHVHLLWEPAIDTCLPLCIANGVTGVRDMHTHFPFEQIHAWHKEVEAGQRVGPRFVYAGPMLDGPQPIWPGSIAVGTPEAGRAAVRRVKAGGAAFVKVYE